MSDTDFSPITSISSWSSFAESATDPRSVTSIDIMEEEEPHEDLVDISEGPLSKYELTEMWINSVQKQQNMDDTSSYADKWSLLKQFALKELTKMEEPEKDISQPMLGACSNNPAECFEDMLGACSNNPAECFEGMLGACSNNPAEWFEGMPRPMPINNNYIPPPPPPPPGYDLSNLKKL